MARPAGLSPDQIQKVQAWSLQGLSTSEMKERMPELVGKEHLVTSWAPTLLRGKRAELLLWLSKHKGIDYKDINFRELDLAPKNLATMLYQMRRQNIITFTERQIALIRGHGSTSPGDAKGIFNINLTKTGERHVTLLTAQSAQEKIAAKTSFDGIKEIRQIDPAVLDAPVEAVEVKEVEEDKEIPYPPPFEVVHPVLQETGNLTDLMEFVQKKYPLLAELRKREGRIHAANRLLTQALDLYDKGDMTEEALRLMEQMSQSQAKFSPIERELMRLAEDVGI